MTRPHVLRWVAMGASIGALASACAAGSAPGDAPPPATKPQHSSKPALSTTAEFCDARAAAECSQAVVAACGSASRSACEGARAKACLAAVPQGTRYQAAQAPACLHAVGQAYATSTLTAAALASIASACGAPLFAGPGDARAPCMTDYDCDSSMKLRCVMPNPPPLDNMGQCFVPTTVQPGGDCRPQGSICGAGTHCEATGLTCVADAQMGDACNPPDYPCASGLTCLGAGPFATCAAGGTDGTACHAGTDCSSGLCDKATDQSGGTCASSVTLSSLDGMCQGFH